jgi:hypothetical protein
MSEQDTQLRRTYLGSSDQSGLIERDFRPWLIGRQGSRLRETESRGPPSSAPVCYAEIEPDIVPHLALTSAHRADSPDGSWIVRCAVLVSALRGARSRAAGIAFWELLDDA